MASIDYPLERPDIEDTGWHFAENLYRWIATVDHKKLGLMYIVSALIFLCVAGVMAVVIRLQLAFPNGHVVDPDTYDRLFTMHGTTMVFLVGMPIVAGLSNYLVPLMIGARDMAFPRLNSFGFWIFLFGGLLLYYSYIGGSGLSGAGSAPDVGWFAYAPLTTKSFSRGHSVDYWALGVLVSGFGSIASAINVIATTISLRCPGMTLSKMPMFVWVMLVDAWLILIALPPLSAGQIMLLLDRYLGANFFNTQHGGSAVLWQHIFWIFGHPEVYILIFPAFAILSELVPIFSRKPLFGRPAMVGAVVAIGFISLGVWAHHMFAVGMTSWSNTFFAASSMLVGIPTGIKIFNWTATMYGGRIRLLTPMLFCCAFLLQFLVAGLTGIMLAVAPFDWQLHDSYFVVAHFHFTLAGGLVTALFGGFYYWYPKVAGRMYNETLAKWHFWLFIIGFNLTFIPLHFAGTLGMPRRIYTYAPGRGWEIWNQLASLGALMQAAAVTLFAWNVIYSAIKGEPAGDDPWDAWTLEWGTTSPPPEYNFEKLPVVRSSRPLWDLKHPNDPDWKYE
ncbi:MAG: cytochrome c oxidase subunit I [Acidobacteriaceae bacterium]|nr:cytochrome c oxidase subunit I [Acidobacteriaceae bacterium]MBV9502338.1 cytochrome c oxidase subunit I [Acidobacteriaceae bacterium]